ncbi:FAD-binding protein [Alphaproteobacteria bacterium]|nr:FAD-binding protein [Alphaproteobacteria bacterium]
MSILPSKNIKYDIEVPIVIIGGGACGICAAISAKENGVESIIIERDATPSGSTALSTCLIPGANSKLQKEAKINDSAEIFAEDIIKKAKGRNDINIVKFIAEESGKNIDWLVNKIKIELSLVKGFYYPGHSKYRMHGSPNRTGTELMDSLNSAISREKITIITSAHAINLYADSYGKVHGVKIIRPNGQIEKIGCKGLILACNGYGGNPTMVKKYIPEIMEALYYGHTGNKGDAVNWGRELGAKIDDMGGYQGHGAVTHPHGTLLFWGLLTTGGFQININGDRFSNEVRGYSEQAVDVVSQPENVAWEIWSSEGHELGIKFQDYKNGIEIGAHKKGNSILDISEITNIPVEKLENTISKINNFIKNSEVDNFGRSWKEINKIQPPYYFAKVTGALFHTQGGLVVNNQARVISNKGNLMPNLFAGGGAARGISGPSRWGYLSGNGLLTATVLGRSAGINCANLLK